MAHITGKHDLHGRVAQENGGRYARPGNSPLAEHAPSAKTPGMLTRVSITNYRSFIHAEADLSPFTLVIGANGSGKTNFLKFFRRVTRFFRPLRYRF